MILRVLVQWALVAEETTSALVNIDEFSFVLPRRKDQAAEETSRITDRVNNVTRNNTFGAGAYPTNPVSTFNQITAVGDPRTLQFGVRLTF